MFILYRSILIILLILIIFFKNKVIILIFILFIVTDEEILRKDNIYRHLEDYPDIDFRICLITHDGFIVLISNEA
jgi:hypothetical protein